ncbi:MAG: CinA family nicotinamide mononucleotide deamidase-related protein, partial [Planctomycetota bacterium]
MTDPDPRTVGIVAVGDELLAGAHPDLNSPWIAARVQELGYRTRRVFVVGDDEDDIAAAVTRAAEGAMLVFVSGGLGPTLDDVTRHGVARSVEAELEVDDAAWEEIQAFFARAGRETKPSNRRQALRPVGANVVPNAFGTAPGFRAQHPTGATVFVLPGPPREMQGVFAAEVEPWLAARPVDGRVRVKAIATFADLSESQFADAVGAWMERDANPLVGVTVKDGVLTARAVGSAATEPEARALAEARVADVAALFPDHHVGGDIGRGLGRFVGEELVRLGVTFTLAESCTGGLVAATVLDAPGLSAVLRNTWVTYANEAKVELLGVPSGVIERHGAVSAECAGAMAAGALERSGARVAVSVSGVAGPDGGTETKPVGLVWFGVARQGPGGTVVRTYERRW